MTARDAAGSIPPGFLTLVTGGARSGKSRYAEGLVSGWAAGGPVTYVATLAAGDAELADRIARHRARRPSAWTTVEAPRDPAAAVAGAAPEAPVLVDCLSGWVSNELLARLGMATAPPARTGIREDKEGPATANGPASEPDRVAAAIDAVLAGCDALATAARDHGGPVVVVTNEVGAGVVPPSALGRAYRDALGLANQRIAGAAAAAALVSVGIPLVLKGNLPTPDSARAPTRR